MHPVAYKSSSQHIFQSKLEKEIVTNMGLFWASCSLDPQAITEIHSGNPASILTTQKKDQTTQMKRDASQNMPW